MTPAQLALANFIRQAFDTTPSGQDIEKIADLVGDIFAEYADTPRVFAVIDKKTSRIVARPDEAQVFKYFPLPLPIDTVIALSKAILQGFSVETHSCIIVPQARITLPPPTPPPPFQTDTAPAQKH